MYVQTVQLFAGLRPLFSASHSGTTRDDAWVKGLSLRAGVQFHICGRSWCIVRAWVWDELFRAFLLAAQVYHSFML